MVHRIRSVLTFFFHYYEKLSCLSFLYLLIGPTTLSILFCAICESPASDDTQKSHRSRHRVHKSTGSSHKTMSRSLSCDSQSKSSIYTPRGTMVYDFFYLHVHVLFLFVSCFLTGKEHKIFLLSFILILV